jgi:hypothetical protein
MQKLEEDNKMLLNQQVINNGTINNINNKNINNGIVNVNIVAFGKENMDFVIDDISKLCQGKFKQQNCCLNQ